MSKFWRSANVNELEFAVSESASGMSIGGMTDVGGTCRHSVWT